MIEGKNLKFTYGDKQLYNNASFKIFRNEHVVLVGENGVGKSTLMKLIYKNLIPDAGFINWEPNIKIGYLDQYMSLDDELIVKTYLYDVFNDLFEKEKLMNNYYEQISEKKVEDKDVDKILQYAYEIQNYLIEANFYHIKSLVSNIINGLGLSMDVLDKKIKHLSSGMRSKIILAKLLLEENDLILLDEPTNFLDNEHINWLTRYLNDYPNAFLVISHNEKFLNDIAKVVLEISNQEIIRYKGDYNFYLQEREIRLNNKIKQYESQQRLIKETNEFINKNIVRASTSKRAKSRKKMLDKIKIINKVKEKPTYKFHFPIKSQTGKEVLKVKDLSIGYNNIAISEKINFVIRNREKVVITGVNGIGKSTLINTVMGVIPKIEGSIYWDKNASISYLKQDDFYLTNNSAFEVISDEYPNLNKTEIMALLASYGINYDMAQRSINTLSGGEQTKIKIALLQNKYANILILDEPTNHLDYLAKEALKEALINYEGTLILVSHEKEFYEEICDYEISLS